MPDTATRTATDRTVATVDAFTNMIDAIGGATVYYRRGYDGNGNPVFTLDDDWDTRRGCELADRACAALGIETPDDDEPAFDAVVQALGDAPSFVRDTIGDGVIVAVVPTDDTEPVFVAGKVHDRPRDRFVGLLWVDNDDTIQTLINTNGIGDPDATTHNAFDAELVGAIGHHVVADATIHRSGNSIRIGDRVYVGHNGETGTVLGFPGGVNGCRLDRVRIRPDGPLGDHTVFADTVRLCRGDR